MSRRSRSSEMRRSCTGTLIIFALIGFIGWVTYTFIVERPLSSRATPQESATSTQSTSPFKLLLVHEKGTSLMSEDGTMVLISTSTQSHGPKTWASPEKTYSVRMGGAQDDAASTLLFTHASDAEQKVVLREKRTALKDTTILGWFSDRELAIASHATTSYALYSVTPAGSLRYLVRLPEELVMLTGQGGMVWYATAVPGPGIESPPQGPSAVHRVDGAGADTIVTREESRAILSVLPDPHSSNDRLAYTTDSGESIIYTVHDRARISIGSQRPILFLKSGDLVTRDGSTVNLYTIANGSTKKIGILPTGTVDVLDGSAYTAE